MTEKIKQTLKHGTWLYGGVTKSDVWIIRQNYFEGPALPEEEKTPGYPPTDAEGCFYLPSYNIPGAGAGSGGPVFGSMEEAVRHAETIVKSGVTWDKNSGPLTVRLSNGLTGIHEFAPSRHKPHSGTDPGRPRWRRIGLLLLR
jgi:hypothetical protein